MALPAFSKGNLGSNPRIILLRIQRKIPETDRPYLVIMERDENYFKDERDNEICTASLTLHYQLIRARHDSIHTRNPAYFFTASYCRISNFVSLSSSDVGSSGGIFIEPAELCGHHLGTYLMNIIVAWVKQWPLVEVRPIELLTGQSNNKERRNQFYEQFNLRFEWKDAITKVEGASKPMQAKDLCNVDTWKKFIEEMHVDKALSIVEHDNTQLQYQLEQCRKSNLEMSVIYKTPFNWAAKCFWRLYKWYLIYGIAVFVPLWIRYG